MGQTIIVGFAIPEHTCSFVLTFLQQISHWYWAGGSCEICRGPGVAISAGGGILTGGGGILAGGGEILAGGGGILAGGGGEEVSTGGGIFTGGGGILAGGGEGKGGVTGGKVWLWMISGWEVDGGLAGWSAISPPALSSLWSLAVLLSEISLLFVVSFANIAANFSCKAFTWIYSLMEASTPKIVSILV